VRGRLWWKGLKSKLAEDRYIVLCTVTCIARSKSETKQPKHKKTIAKTSGVLDAFEEQAFGWKANGQGNKCPMLVFHNTNPKQTLFWTMPAGATRFERKVRLISFLRTATVGFVKRQHIEGVTVLIPQ